MGCFNFPLPILSSFFSRQECDLTVCILCGQSRYLPTWHGVKSELRKRKGLFRGKQALKVCIKIKLAFFFFLACFFLPFVCCTNNTELSYDLFPKLNWAGIGGIEKKDPVSAVENPTSQKRYIYIYISHTHPSSLQKRFGHLSIEWS